MSIWKKLFGIKSESELADEAINKIINRDKDRIPKTSIEMENMVKPLIRSASKMILAPASKPTKDSQRTSHFGGQPYIEKGEQWPTNKENTSLDFVFQVFNSPELHMPDDIKLIQFYYDWEGSAWETDDDGWLVKIYNNLDTENQTAIEKPSGLSRSKYCKISFIEVLTLPDWEGIDVHHPEASALSSKLNGEYPWEYYDDTVNKLIGEPDYQSQLGGYPQWVQGESTPTNDNGNLMNLLFQIDTEDEAMVMWGDAGLVYVFYDPESGKVEFELQCH